MTCVVHECNNDGADEMHQLLITLCREHGLAIARTYGPIIIADHEREKRQAAERAESREQKRQGNDGGQPVVYYAAIGDYIKIGYTTRLRDRLATLRADRLLAWEPGGYDLEQQRHKEFTASRLDLRRENFKASVILSAHIAGVREQHGLPEWAARPRTSQITQSQKEGA